MTPDDFATGLWLELLRRGVTTRWDDLLRYTTEAWPLIQKDPDVARWADAFLEGAGPAGEE